eukprot:TRINITY_DN2615_c0_g1_i1.p1 TRINITY_DN2615_c0_g1~~TRINITY_DN2615_c0_g1_i1.p1  ORF type:complete len:630 (+),score=183.89 TRINITY_DN2615_c0_g1_i1:40-1890(+)
MNDELPSLNLSQTVQDRESMSMYLKELTQTNGSKVVSDKNTLIEELTKVAIFFEDELNESSKLNELMKRSLDETELNRQNLKNEVRDLKIQLETLTNAVFLPMNTDPKELELSIRAISEEMSKYSRSQNISGQTPPNTKGMMIDTKELTKTLSLTHSSKELQLASLLDLKFKKLQEFILLLKARLIDYERNIAITEVLQNHGSIENLLESNTRLKKENEILRGREKRFVTEPLLRRRNLSQSSPSHLEFLIHALQNELFSLQEENNYLYETLKNPQKPSKFINEFVNPSKYEESLNEIEEFLKDIPVYEFLDSDKEMTKNLNRNELIQHYEALLAEKEAKIQSLQEYFGSNHQFDKLGDQTVESIEQLINSYTHALGNTSLKNNREQLKRVERIVRENVLASKELKAMNENVRQLNMGEIQNKEIIQSFQQENLQLKKLLIENTNTITTLKEVLAKSKKMLEEQTSTYRALFDFSLENLNSKTDSNQTENKNKISSLETAILTLKNSPPSILEAKRLKNVQDLIHNVNHEINITFKGRISQMFESAEKDLKSTLQNIVLANEKILCKPTISRYVSAYPSDFTNRCFQVGDGVINPQMLETLATSDSKKVKTSSRKK